jgi:hypothetical protein
MTLEPVNPNDVASITDAPGLWGTENAVLHLELRDADVVGPAGASPVRFEMHALPPMRISADSLDLIALPLVDIVTSYVSQNRQRTFGQD